MPSTTEILDVLRTIDDPEMPINIVDLGLVVDIRTPAIDRVEIDLTPTFIGCPALDLIRDLVRTRVSNSVRLPVDGIRVNYLNQPRWTTARISEAGRARLRAFGITTPESEVCCAAATEDETAPALTRAAHSGGEPVALTIGGAPAQIACPYCQSPDTQRESAFGPTRCRMIYYCPACKNSFEHLKPI